MAPGLPRAMARRPNSREQLKVPSRSIWTTVLKPFGDRSSAGDREIASSVVEKDVHRTRGTFNRIERRLYGCGIPHIERCLVRPCHRFPDRLDTPSTMLLLATQDGDRGAEPRKLQTERLAQSGPSAGDGDDPASNVPFGNIDVPSGNAGGSGMGRSSRLGPVRAAAKPCPVAPARPGREWCVSARSGTCHCRERGSSGASPCM